MFEIRRARRGITLLELMMSIMLISAMLVAVWAVYYTGYQIFFSQSSRENIKAQASTAFLTMTEELHQATVLDSATYPPTSLSITFTADLKSDGNPQTIQYVWSGVAGQPLNRNIIVGGVVTQTIQLVRSVNNPVPLINNPLFNYFGANNTALGTTPTASQVRLVAIDLYTTSGSETFHIRTKVQLRCI